MAPKKAPEPEPEPEAEEAPPEPEEGDGTFYFGDGSKYGEQHTRALPRLVRSPARCAPDAPAPLHRGPLDDQGRREDEAWEGDVCRGRGGGQHTAELRGRVERGRHERLRHLPICDQRQV